MVGQLYEWGETKLNALAAEIFVGGSLDVQMKSINGVDPEVTRKRSTALLYAERRLSEWAKWANKNREGLGYPTVATLYTAMRERLEPGKMKWKIPKIGENDEAPILTAMGKETRSFIPPTVGEAPEAVMEIDAIVIKLPKDLHEVIVADYFSYGPIEARCKKTRWRKARYSQLLECAKYYVYAALDSRTKVDLQD